MDKDKGRRASFSCSRCHIESFGWPATVLVMFQVAFTIPVVFPILGEVNAVVLVGGRRKLCSCMRFGARVDSTARLERGGRAGWKTGVVGEVIRSQNSRATSVRSKGPSGGRVCELAGGRSDPEPSNTLSHLHQHEHNNQQFDQHQRHICTPIHFILRRHPHRSIASLPLQPKHEYGVPPSLVLSS